MKKIDIPVTILPRASTADAVVGPGSQPPETDGAEMAFMQMPANMTTYSAPTVPEPDEIEGLEPALELAESMLQAINGYNVNDKSRVIELGHLDENNRLFFNQLLGDGEVSIQGNGDINAVIQESVLAGIWRVHYVDQSGAMVRDTMEIGAIPGVVSELTFADAQTGININALQIPDDVYNAPPLLTEINEKLPEYRPGAEPHIINLSLLPHTEQDLLYLSDALGIGPVIILSRGYGNCRLSSTGTRNVWWVQYFNSQETLILNTLEINEVPAVACASQEDIEDSTARLDEILSIYREPVN